jgi:hypothetical protein
LVPFSHVSQLLFTSFAMLMPVLMLMLMLTPKKYAE